MTEEERKVFEECLWWLEGALKCKAWIWDTDQREAAQHVLDKAQTMIQEANK